MRLSRKTERIMSLLAGGILLAGSIAIAAPAFATVSNCDMTTTPHPAASGGKIYIEYSAAASCPASTKRTYSVTLYHIYDFLPFAAVDTTSYTGTRKTYSVDNRTCDNGGTTTYQTYSELFDSQTKVAQSKAREFTHC